MKNDLHVVLVTPEAAPFAKSGELAEFCGSLPRYLSSLGLKVSLVLPRYSTPQIAALEGTAVFPEIPVPLNGERARATVLRAEQKGFDIYLIDSPKYFLRENIYGPPTGNYLDNDERFIFFSRAALEFLRRADFSTDVIHCHNWPTALIPVFLRSHYREEPSLKSAAAVLTLHNPAYQGEFPAESLALTELNWDFLGPRGHSSNGKINFLQAGAAHADFVNTVSRACAKELLARKNASGLSRVLRTRRKAFGSVGNGLDREAWDPQRDPYIAANFGPGRLDGKTACKRDLAALVGLSAAMDKPLAAFVSHLSRQKGADILAQSLEAIVGAGAAVVVCAEGEERFRKEFETAGRRFPGQVAFRFESGAVLMHKVMAGADILLLPSLTEPSGLNLFAAFRYGTVPVVRATGGLKEAVRPYNRRKASGNGFVFDDYAAEALVRAVGQASECYTKNPAHWQTLAERGMEEHFSWAETARGYADIYQKALEIKRGGSKGHGSS
jgi:starch synthase